MRTRKAPDEPVLVPSGIPAAVLYLGDVTRESPGSGGGAEGPPRAGTGEATFQKSMCGMEATVVAIWENAARHLSPWKSTRKDFFVTVILLHHGRPAQAAVHGVLEVQMKTEKWPTY